MEEMESAVGGQRRRILLVVLIVLLVYILLLGRQGVASEITIDGSLAYVATGPYGGVRILDITDPVQIREVGFYQTLGSASRLTLSGKQAFIADGKAGMEVVDITDPTMPVAIGSIDLVGETLDVSLAGDFAYLSMGKEGIAIVNISDRVNPVIVGSVDTPGTARASTVMQVYTASEGLVPGSPEFNQNARLQGVYLYVADGSSGLQILDVTVPTQPVIIGSINSPGVAQDITMTSFVGFLADGKSGVQVYDLRNPSQPLEIANYDTPGYARSVSLAGTQLYVADGDGGLAVIDVSDLAHPQQVQAYTGLKDVEGVAASGNIVFLAAGQQGVQAVQMSSGAPYPVGFWETPGDASLDQIVQGGWYLLAGRLGEVQPKVGRTILEIVFDIVLFFVLTGFWLMFYAQFILPVRTLRDRRRAAERVVAYHLGTRGPAIFIENGEIHSRRREEGRLGPGVAIIDTASAAVFRTEHSFTRATGPGLVFTGRREVPAGVIDLHRQTRTLGPNFSENPFDPQAEDESPDNFRERQQRRYSTSSLTRDGVEVIPDITVTFSLDAVPGEGGTQYGYKGSSVWRAIVREGIDPLADPGSERRHIEWSWLPARIAVDIWREHLRKFTLDELFTFTGPQQSARFLQLPPPSQPDGVVGLADTGFLPLPRVTAFDIIQTNIRERMTHLEADELDEFGRRTGTRRPSKEYELLHSRGIKVAGVSIHSLRFPDEVETRLVEQWQTSWLERAQEEVRLGEVLHSQQRLEGQDLASKEFALATSLVLGSALEVNPNIPLKESLRLLVQGTLKLCVREVELSPRLTNQKSALVEMVEWIGKQ